MLRESVPQRGTIFVSYMAELVAKNFLSMNFTIMFTRAYSCLYR